jgi:hypothetical protein
MQPQSVLQVDKKKLATTNGAKVNVHLMNKIKLNFYTKSKHSWKLLKHKQWNKSREKTFAGHRIKDNSHSGTAGSWSGRGASLLDFIG